jgi:hypothetical protein
MRTIWKVLIGIIVIFSIGLTFFLLNKSPSTNPKNETQLNEDKAYLTWVSGTEYIAGDSFGQAVVEVQDYKGRPLNASCNLTMLYPDQTFVFIDAPMTLSSLAGHYYKDFTVPNTFGIYVEMANCTVTLNGKDVWATKSNAFHINPAFDYLVQIGNNITQIQNNITNIQNQINSLSTNMNNNFTYTNNLINSISFNGTQDYILENITQQFQNQTSFINTWFWTIENKIDDFRDTTYNMLNTIYTILVNYITQWVDKAGGILKDIIGSGASIQGGTQGTGASNPDCGLWRRILGQC